MYLHLTFGDGLSLPLLQAIERPPDVSNLLEVVSLGSLLDYPNAQAKAKDYILNYSLFTYCTVSFSMAIEKTRPLDLIK